MKAPPRKNWAPPSFTALAASRSCSMLSTEQGPAITTSRLPPTGTPATSITESSGWNSRLTSLYFSVMRTVFSTPDIMFISRLAMVFLSPMTPTIVRSSPVDRWAFRPTRSSFRVTFAKSSWVAPGLITMIISFPPASLPLYLINSLRRFSSWRFHHSSGTSGSQYIPSRPYGAVLPS